MKNLLIMAVLALSFSVSNASAEDFNSHSYAINAQGEKFGVSLFTGSNFNFADDSIVFGINTNGRPIDLGIQYIEKDGLEDYRFTASKGVSYSLPGATPYATFEAHYTLGDNYAKDEVRISPFVGVKVPVGNFVPFVEAGYDWVSYEGDFLNISGIDSYAKLGVELPVSERSNFAIAIRHEMDQDLNEAEQQLEVTFNVAF
jgi:opacity protein-like surface antigen